MVRRKGKNELILIQSYKSAISVDTGEGAKEETVEEKKTKDEYMSIIWMDEAPGTDELK